MEDAGQKLKRIRERLGLRYRDVEEFSQRIADRHKNNEFAIALSRLADIENRGTVPSIYRLYTLCAIYRLDLPEVIHWYGLQISDLPADAALLHEPGTHLVGLSAASIASLGGGIQVPLALDPGFDVQKTTFLSRIIQRWGTLPLMLLNGMDLPSHRYGFIGEGDWFMYPLLHPGSLVLIDESRRRIAAGGWLTEFERPIYFLEHREGYACGWCSLADDRLVLHPHPASPCQIQTYAFPAGVEVLGQVVGMATRLDPLRQRPTRA